MDSLRSAPPQFSSAPPPLAFGPGFATAAQSARAIPWPGSSPDRIDLGSRAHALVRDAEARYRSLLGNGSGAAFDARTSFVHRAAAFSPPQDVAPFARALASRAAAVTRIGEVFDSLGIGREARAPSNGVVPVVPVVRDVGGAHPSFDLRTIEGGVPGTPHTLAQHVAKDDAFLAARIAAGKHEASSFASLIAAQRSVDAVIGEPRNQERISRWIAGGTATNLRLDGFVVGGPIGGVLTRADVARGAPSHATGHATVILKSDPASPAKYTILTAYPSFPGSL